MSIEPRRWRRLIQSTLRSAAAGPMRDPEYLYRRARPSGSSLHLYLSTKPCKGSRGRRLRHRAVRPGDLDGGSRSSACCVRDRWARRTPVRKPLSVPFRRNAPRLGCVFGQRPLLRYEASSANPFPDHRNARSSKRRHRFLRRRSFGLENPTNHDLGHDVAERLMRKTAYSARTGSIGGSQRAVFRNPRTRFPEGRPRLKHDIHGRDVHEHEKR